MENLPLPLSVGALIASALLWLGYRWLVASMEKKLNHLLQTQKLDLFASLPNYTRLGFRWTFGSCLILFVPVLMFFLVLSARQPSADKVLGTLGAAAVLAFCGILMAFISALTGNYVERRLITKLTRLEISKQQVSVSRPFWNFAFQLVGKRLNQWPYYLTAKGGEARLALITTEALNLSRSGYLVDTWPKLPRITPTIFWIVFIITLPFSVVHFLFQIYLLPLFTKNVYFPEAVNAELIEHPAQTDVR